MKLKLSNLIFVSVMIVIVSYVCVFYLSACDEYLSTTQWEARSKPADVNQAKVMVILEQGRQEAQQKAKSAAQIDSIKFWCFLGLGGALVAIFLGTAAIKQIAFGLAIICGAMIAIVQFYTTFPILFAYAGGVIALGAAGYAIWQHKKDFKINEADLKIHKTANVELVQTVDEIKPHLTPETKGDLFGDGFGDGIIKTEIQSPATTELVSKIRNNKDS
jgi:hypothetical protein